MAQVNPQIALRLLQKTGQNVNPGMAGRVAGMGGRALRVLGPVSGLGAVAGLGLGAQQVLAAGNDRDIAGYGVGTVGGGALGAGVGLGLTALTGGLGAPLIPILASVGSYAGGELGGRNLNLIQSDEEKFQISVDEAEKRRNELINRNPNNLEVKAIADNRYLADINRAKAEYGGSGKSDAERQADKALNSVLGGSAAASVSGGNGDTTGTSSSGLDMDGFRPMTDREVEYSAFDPNGTMYRGMENKAEADFNRGVRAQRIAHEQGMQYSGMQRQSELANSMLNYALGDTASHRQYLASLVPRINYQ